MQKINLTFDHWPSVKKIYEEGMATGNATFLTSAPEGEAWDIAYIKTTRFVAEENGVKLGWAALSAVSGRYVYSGVAEISVYVTAAESGKGIGKN